MREEIEDGKEVDVSVLDDMSFSSRSTSIKTARKQPSNGRWLKFPRSPNGELVPADFENALDTSTEAGVSVSQYLSDIIQQRRKAVESAKRDEEMRRELELASLDGVPYDDVKEWKKDDT